MRSPLHLQPGSSLRTKTKATLPRRYKTCSTTRGRRPTSVMGCGMSALDELWQHRRVPLFNANPIGIYLGDFHHVCLLPTTPTIHRPAQERKMLLTQNRNTPIPRFTRYLFYTFSLLHGFPKKFFFCFYRTLLNATVFEHVRCVHISRGIPSLCADLPHMHTVSVFLRIKLKFYLRKIVFECLYLRDLTKNSKQLLITDFITTSQNVNISASNIESAQITSSDESEFQPSIPKKRMRVISDSDEG